MKNLNPYPSNQDVNESTQQDRPPSRQELALQAAGSPPKIIKKYVSTVSYLRPATDNKAISDHLAGGRPQRLQSAGNLQGSQARTKMAKKRAALLKAVNQANDQQSPPGGNAKSLQTRASANQSGVSSDPINIVTDKNPLPNANKHPVHLHKDGNDQSVITFKSLQEGELFDKDIKRIMAIINGVEQ